MKTRIAEVRRAVLPEAEMADLLDAQLDRLEAGYLAAVERMGRNLALTQRQKDLDLGAVLRYDEIREAFVLGALVRGHRDLIRKDILSATKHWPADLRLSEPERISTLDKLHRDLYALELSDEAAVDAGQATRRDDADARAVLGLPEEVAFSSLVLKVHEAVG